MWKTVRLGDVCEILDRQRKPITKRNRKSGPIPYYGATGVVDWVSDYIFDEPLILVGEDGAKWGEGERTAFLIEGKSWVNNHAHVIRPKKGIVLREWISHYLTAIDLSPWVTGLTIPKLNQAKLRSIPLPLPPLAEQKRIVERLDKAFAEIDKGIATAEVKKEEVERLKAAMLNEDLEDLLSEKPHVCLSDVCPRVSVGHVGTTSKHYCDDGIPFIRTQNVSKYGFDDTELKYITREFHEALKKSQIKAGDVLLTRVVIDEMRTAVVPENYGEANCANVILIRPSDDLDSQFLSLLIKSEKSQRYFMGVKKGAAQQVVNTGILKAWRLPLPPLTEQRDFVRRTLTKFRHIDKAMESIDLSAQRSSELKVAILKQELTPSEAV